MVDEITPEPQEQTGGSMPFLHHLEELRRRLLKSLLSVGVMAGVAFYFSDELIKFIRIPFGDIPLYNIQVTGTFYAYLKIALFTGVFAALPIVFYQMWAFVSPGLYRREKKAILPLVIVSTILFLVGAAFCFVVMLPLAFQYLLGFSGGEIQNQITISSYIDFIGLLLIAFGFSFEMPIVAYFLGKMGIISSSFLAKGRRYAIVVILIVAAIITPPDVITQVMLAVPMYALYEVSIIVVRLTGRRREEVDAAAGEISEAPPE
ncbi:MAG: twin-arginine translocase subunit TatC [Candidatus Zixiibacteriota bacterium]